MNERISIIKHRSQICSTPQNLSLRASLVVQWLRFWAPNAGASASHQGQMISSLWMEVMYVLSRINYLLYFSLFVCYLNCKGL